VVVVAFSLGGDRMDAWRLAFQPQLGPAWFVIGAGQSITLALLHWWFKFDAYAPKIFIEAGASPQVVDRSHGCCHHPLVWRRRKPQNVTTYGSARWADIKEFGARDFCGRTGSAWSSWWQLFRHDGPEHVAVFCADAVRKGVGLVIPTL